MRLRNALFLAAVFGLSAAAASAQDRGQRFVQRDGNGDGVLSLHEYQSTGGHPGNFRALDTDGDGVLDHGEFVGRGGVAGEQGYAVDEYEEARQRARSNEAVRVERPSRARAARSRTRRGSDGIARRTLQRFLNPSAR